MKKKPNYAEARRLVIQNAYRLNSSPFIPPEIKAETTEAQFVAAEALERLSKQPAMKDHERIFFALCYNLRHTHKPRAVVNLLADTIPHKRCWYYLRKWGNLGFYNYGVTEDLGWFELDKIPQRYREIVQEENAQPANVVMDGEKIAEAVYHTARAAIEDLLYRAENILRKQAIAYRQPTVEITAVDLATPAPEKEAKP